MRIPAHELKAEFKKILMSRGFDDTNADYPATYQFEEDDLDDPAHALRAAIYTAMEVRRNRKAYDEAHESPLPKLYHERKDDSEKVRFAVSKRKEQQDGANA